MVWRGRDWSRGLAALHSIVPCQTAGFLCKSGHEFCREATLTPTSSSVLHCSLWGSCIRREAVASEESICTTGWCVLLLRMQALGSVRMSSCSPVPATASPQGRFERSSCSKPPSQNPHHSSSVWFSLLLSTVQQNLVLTEKEKTGFFGLMFVISALLLVVQVQALFSHGWEDPVQNQSRTQTTVLDFWV